MWGIGAGNYFRGYRTVVPRWGSGAGNFFRGYRTVYSRWGICTIDHFRLLINIPIVSINVFSGKMNSALVPDTKDISEGGTLSKTAIRELLEGEGLFPEGRGDIWTTQLAAKWPILPQR